MVRQVLSNVPNNYWLLRLLSAFEGTVSPGQDILAVELCKIAGKNSKCLSLEPCYLNQKAMKRYILEGYFQYTRQVHTFPAKWYIRITDKGRVFYYRNRKTLWEMDNIS